MSGGSYVLCHACGSQRMTCRYWLVLSFHCGGSPINLRLCCLAASAFSCRVSSPAPSNIGLKSHFTNLPHCRTVRRECSTSLLNCYWMLRFTEFQACLPQPRYSTHVIVQWGGPSFPLEVWMSLLGEGVCSANNIVWILILLPKTCNFCLALSGTHAFGIAIFWGASSRRERAHVL